MASAIAQIQQKQILQQTSAGLRTTGIGPLNRLATARNSIAVGRSTNEETLINKIAQAAVQGLNQPAYQLSAEQPCCLGRKTSLIPGVDHQQICHAHHHHQLHTTDPNLLQQQLLQQQQISGRPFDHRQHQNVYLHPNDAASLAANRPSWSAGNVAAAAATGTQNPNAANNKLLALFVPRAGSLDA